MDSLNSAVLKELSGLIKEMIFEQKPKELSEFQNELNFIMKAGGLGLVVWFVSLIIAVVAIDFVRPESEIFGLHVISAILLLMVATLVVICLLMVFYLHKAHTKKNSLVYCYELFDIEMIGDLENFNKLLTYPKPYLQYFLTQKRGKFYIPLKRSFLFGGDLQKIGLVPAIVALAFSSKLLDHGPISDIIVLFCILASGCLITSFVMSTKYERSNQVVQLLQLAIDMPVTEGKANREKKTTRIVE